MKKAFYKILTLAICLCMIFTLSACKKEAEKVSNTVELRNTSVSFRYSPTCSDWVDVTTDTAIFANDEWAEGDIEIAYFNIKNLGNDMASYKLSLVTTGEIEGAVFGIVKNKRVAYSDKNAAVNDIEGKTYSLTSDYVFSDIIDADNVLTVALVVTVPEREKGGKGNIGVEFSASTIENTENKLIKQNGYLGISGSAFGSVTDSSIKNTIANEDGTFKVTFAENAVSQGAFVYSKITTSSVSDTEASYSLEILSDNEAYSGSAEVAFFAGYGFENLKATLNGNNVSVNYDKFSGILTATVASGGTLTVTHDDASRICGVAVLGTDEIFNTFDEALEYTRNNASGDSLVYLIYGDVMYTVPEGLTVAFAGHNVTLKSVTVAGVNPTSKILISSFSATLPSLPIANGSATINYTNLMFDSAKVDGTMHIDYRGDSDISFTHCTFSRALATRGPKSNVVIDSCVFNAELYEHTLIGYSYYSIKVGSNGTDIKVQFTNNLVTGSWGGINLDWQEADYYVAGNTFANLNCSKPGIQLSRAKTMLIENNVFRDITDENALRFYKAYFAKETTIINNKFDVDYLLHCDNSNAIAEYENFTFEGNTISSTTNIILGHITNDVPEATREHGYTVDTDLNTIE